MIELWLVIVIAIVATVVGIVIGTACTRMRQTYQRIAPPEVDSPPPTPPKVERKKIFGEHTDAR